MRLIYFYFMQIEYDNSFKDDVELILIIVFIENLGHYSQVILYSFSFLV